MSLRILNLRLFGCAHRIRCTQKRYQSPIVNLLTTFGNTELIGWKKPYSSVNRFNHGNNLLLNTRFYSISFDKHFSSSGNNDAAIEEMEPSAADKDGLNIASIFPSPKETLNILQSVSDEKVFDVYYKQNHAKVKKKSKSVADGDWTCTYKIYWPETHKFESTAVSKRNASNKAAYQVLNWLYRNKRINTKGKPIHSQEKLDSILDSLNLPIKLSIPRGCIEEIDTLIAKYRSTIEPIITRCLQQASETNETPQITVHESTLENDGELASEDFSAEIAKENSLLHPVYGTTMQTWSDSDLQRRKKQLDRLLRQFEEGQKIRLPIDDYSTELANTMANNRVMIVVGEPGCGKSTRAPVYAALHAAGVDARVIVSEPRRVAALGLADRVAGELGEQVGRTIGYQVRLRSNLPRSVGGSILYCTSGVLLRRLHNNPGLHGCSHVFLDEAHERDINTDITLLMLKRALELNPGLKVAVMSATLNMNVFTRYFGVCPIVKIPGRIFPVETFYLEDLEKELGVSLVKTEVFSEDIGAKPFVNIPEVAQVVKAVDTKEEEGAVLVFLPGWAEILALKNSLEEHFEGTAAHVIIPIHSKLSNVEQQKIFASSPPGVRKIVLATNIAETSVTIPDVVCVIDTGLQREYQMRRGIGLSTLQLCWVSRAASKQRAGRAGRVTAGKCYRLYTRNREATFAEHAVPEILRVPLEQTVLNCKSYSEQDSAMDFLSQLPEPPSKVAIASAVKDLVKMGALSPETEHLTTLGRRLCSITTHPRLAKALLNSAVLGHARPMANVVTQLSTAIDLFQRSLERKDEIRDIKRSHHPHSDHVALHLVQEGFNELFDDGGWNNTEQYCAKFGLRKDRLKANRALANIHLSQVQENKLYSELESAQSHELTTGLLLSGSDALLCTKQFVRTKGLLRKVREVYTTSGYRAHIGSESINFKIKKDNRAGAVASLLVYFGGMMSEGRQALMVSGSSVLSPLAVVLFCEGVPQLRVKVGSASGLTHSVLTIPQHKLNIEIDHRQAELLLSLRAALWSTIGYYIENGFGTKSIGNETEDMEWFRNSLVTLLTEMLRKEEFNENVV